MPNTHITKNYAAHGGDEWVIGGKLTFLEGATVEGGEGLFDSENESGFAPAAYQADSTASSYTALKEDFNALLAAMRTAGLLAVSANADTGGDES